MPASLTGSGCTVQYTKASINYENMDRLMAYMNTPENQARFGMRLQYSTPTYYMKTLHAKDLEWELKVDDFESYAIGPDQFLVGFYSSRPDFKGFVRIASTQLRAATAALTNAVFLRENAVASIDAAKETEALDVQTKILGVSQHHDAITSSQRRHVHRDYIKSLSIGQASVDASICRVVGAAISGNASAPTLVTCPYLNESTCPASTSGEEWTVVVLQNPTAQPMIGVAVRVPVSGKASVTDYNHHAVVAQTLPPWPQSPFVHNETMHPPSPVVTFRAEVPALGTSTYFLLQSKGVPAPQAAEEPLPSASTTTVLDNGLIRAEFSSSGLLQSLSKAGTTVRVAQTIKYYHASDGSKGPNNPYSSQGASGSGNYIFQPDSAETFDFGTPTVTHVQGPVVSEIRLVFVAKSIEQVYRLVNGSDVLEIEYRLGPIDISDGKGKELISHFETDIESGDVWSSDVNGAQINARKRDSRATLWPGGPEYFNQTDRVAGNYFATNTQASLSDAPGSSKQRRLTVLTDRSQGATSLASGNLELMIHRRLAHGCRWGMCENNQGKDWGKMEQAGLDDTLGAEVVVKHWLSVDEEGADGSSHALTRARARQLNYPPSLLFGRSENLHEPMTSSLAWPHLTQTLPLSGKMPENLELTTWQLLEDGTALLRLTHIYDLHEHPVFSKPVTIDLCEVFGVSLCARLSAAGAGSFVEMSTAGDVPRAQVERLSWKVKGEPEMPPPQNPLVPPVSASAMPITINPADSRTFRLAVSSSHRRLSEEAEGYGGGYVGEGYGDGEGHSESVEL